MEKGLMDAISSTLGEDIITFKSVSGGDISDAYKLETNSRSLFCKVNRSDFAEDMFTKEAHSLVAIQQHKLLHTPEVLGVGQCNYRAFLILEYVTEGRKSSGSLKEFGKSLAHLHSVDIGHKFGWSYDNYIGVLAQENTVKDSWIEFYVEKRLQVQYRLARDRGYLLSGEIPTHDQHIRWCRNHIPEVKPSLVHGDLWGGNYLIDQSGKPYLIDPAIYYGHSEVDLAMSELFSGFGNSFYEGYYSVVPREEGYAERRDLYQLYYLLVHLNLFGGSYYASVKRILDKYF